MRQGTSQEEATLLDVLVDGFEKNETIAGFHWRTLPMPDEAAAARKFEALADEGRRWKGAPIREERGPSRRVVAWPDLAIRQAGRGIMVLARDPSFSAWWHEPSTWDGDPMGPLHAWLAEESPP